MHAIRQYPDFTIHSIMSNSYYVLELYIHTCMYNLQMVEAMGSQLESEREMRRMIDEILELQTAENVPMSFSNSDGNEIQMVPLVQVNNLQETIFTLLDRHQKYDSNLHHESHRSAIITVICTPPNIHRARKLTWHGGLIPHDDVWVNLVETRVE